MPRTTVVPWVAIPWRVHSFEPHQRARDRRERRAHERRHLAVPERLIVEGASTKWVIVGAVAIPTGLIVEMVGALGAVFDDAPVWAIATGVVGCAMMFTGLILVLANWSTHVNQVIPPERRPAPDNYWQRYPTWRTKESMPEQRWLPPVAGIPIFSGSF